MSRLEATPHVKQKDNSAATLGVRPREAAQPDSSQMMTKERTNKQSPQAKLRVLHVIDRLLVGGTEVGILKVIRGLSDDCFEHRICTVRGFDERFARSEGFQGKIYVAGAANSGFQFLLGRLAKAMRDFRPHIVHSRNWGAIETLPAARLSRVPVAIHSEHGYELDMLRGLPKRRRVLRRAVYAAADAVFTVTEELRTYHARQAWLPMERIRVLPNGVDTNRFAYRHREREEIRQRLGFDNGSIVLGSVGRLVPIKDHTTLLQAAEILLGRGMPVKVLLVGSGPELEKYKKFVSGSARLSGQVVFVGEASEVPALLNAMDIFVLPSLSEGMSNTVMEAMSTSLPTVVTGVGGNPELVESERSGWLFKPGDVKGLVDILERLSHDPKLRNDLGQAARERVVDQFSLDAMICRYRDLYLELATKRGVFTAFQG